MFVHRLEDMTVLTRRGLIDRALAAIARFGFAQVVDKEDKAALDARIDAAFDALKSVNDHNALIHKFKTDGFLNQRTTGSRIVYDILLHSPGVSFASKLYDVPQDEIRLDQAPKAVVHLALLLYFDGFDGTHHIASDALAARYPSDIVGKPEDTARVVTTPSINQLRSADEDKFLLMYLRCDDSAIIQFAMASLEGMWLEYCMHETSLPWWSIRAATLTKHWAPAKEYSVQLRSTIVKAQPNNDIARMLIEQAVYATL
ncbi:unnamed protein product [Peronospora destructor]|uniref:Uncharacterized protein n=1 Tax=Peronospora destructor TaxID=86335 RepID=A0AAV0UE21_9STRA|nr:unnamed protein product [Peronospora destructor]